MRKRKKGSTLITVLALSTIFMALGGAILTAVMGTMKSNVNQKIREDLKYAAEGGIEIARSHLRKGNMTIDTRAGKVEDDLDNILMTEKVNNVDVFLEKENGKDVIKSIAYEKNGTKKETITVQYKKDISSKYMGSIFDYGIVAGRDGIEIENIGSMDLDTTVSSGNGVNISGTGTIPNNVPNDIKNVNFKNWGNPVDKVVLESGKVTNTDGYMIGNYDFAIESKKGEYEEIKVTKMNFTMNSQYNNTTGKWEMGELKVVGKPELNPFEVLKNEKKEPVVVIEVEGLNTWGKLTIIMINSKNFEINLNGNLDIVNTVLINKENTRVASENEGVVLKLSNSTIFGEGVTIEKGASVHIANQPSKENGHGILDEDEEKELNKLLQVILVNFGNDEGNNSESSESIEIIEGSFNN